MNEHDKQVIEDVLKNFIGEYNTPETRQKVTVRLTQALKPISVKCKVICSEINNPPDVVDNNDLIVYASKDGEVFYKIRVFCRLS